MKDRQNKFRVRYDGDYRTGDEPSWIYFTLDDLVDHPELDEEGRRLCWALMHNEPDEYTGLTNAEGQEIYEGDVVEYSLDDSMGAVSDEEPEYMRGVVLYEPRVSGYVVTDAPSDGWDVHLWIIAEEAAILGNVHENPELLEES